MATAQERVAAAFAADHSDEAARLLERADPADAAALLAGLPAPVAAEVYRALGPAASAACATALSDETLAAIVDNLPPQAAGAALRAVEPARRDAVGARLGDERREQLRAVLAYPEHTAGALADPLVLALTDDLTVAEAQRQLRGARLHLFYYVYVVERDRTLVGVLAMPELMAAHPKATLAAVMRRDLVRLDAHADLATVAVHPAWRDLDALPVTDAAGRLVGAIRHKTIRRMSWAHGRPMMATIVGLSEVYWAGLSGLLASIASRRPPASPAASAEEDDHVP